MGAAPRCYSSILCSSTAALAISLRRRFTPPPANMQYITGTRTRVTAVDTESPQATVIPIEFHISAPSPVPIAIGIIPNTVVNVVINTGRRRDLPAVTTALMMFTCCPWAESRTITSTHLGFRKRRHPLQHVARGTHRRGAEKPAARVAGGIGVVDSFLDVVNGDEAL